MRRVEQLENLANNLKVTTVEKVFLGSQPSWKHRPLITAYHEVDESGSYVERRAKHFAAQVRRERISFSLNDRFF